MSTFGAFSITLNDYLEQCLVYLRQPLEQLQEQRSELEVTYAVFNDLKEKLDALEDAADRLSQTGSLSIFRAKSVTSSDESIVTATATSSAVTGSHTIFVSQLAHAHTVVSNRYDQDGTSLSQSYAGTKTFSITIGSDSYDVSVTISSGDTNEDVLSAIASAINDATDGAVSASVVLDTPTTCKLSIRSGTTGTVGKMTFTDTDGLLGALGVTNQSQATDTVGGYIYADLGNNELDALLTIDGINIVSSSNTVENVLEGLTINLLAEQEQGDAPVTITVSIDVESITSEIEDFLSAFNDAYSYIVTKTNVDSDTYERGALAGEFAYTRLRTELREIMTRIVSGVSSTYQALSQIGITSDRSGNFRISDEELLEEALASDLEGVEALFNSENGVASAIEELISEYTAPGGTISASQEAINSKMDVIDDRIDRQEYYIELREKDLRRRYGALQDTLYALQMASAVAESFSAILGL